MFRKWYLFLLLALIGIGGSSFLLTPKLAELSNGHQFVTYADDDNNQGNCAPGDPDLRIVCSGSNIGVSFNNGYFTDFSFTGPNVNYFGPPTGTVWGIPLSGGNYSWNGGAYAGPNCTVAPNSGNFNVPAYACGQPPPSGGSITISPDGCNGVNQPRIRASWGGSNVSSYTVRDGNTNTVRHGPTPYGGNQELSILSAPFNNVPVYYRLQMTGPGGTVNLDSNQIIAPNCSPTPTAAISANPPTGWAPAGTTISWNTANLPGGTTCSNNWNSFLPITPNTSGSDYRTLNAGSYTFSISCSNGTSASTTFTVSQLPPPNLATLSTGCNYSSPTAALRITAPSNYPGGMYINLYLYNTSNLAFQVYLNPGQSYDVGNTSFYGGNSSLSPNGYSTFYATTNVSGLSASNPSSLAVFIPNCPSPPYVTSAANDCNGSNYLPYNNISYNASTYGSPTAYHLDRKIYGQSFAWHGDGYVGTFGSGSNVVSDSNAVVNNQSYSYRMRAENSLAQSTPSNVVSVTSRNCSPPQISASARCIDGYATPEYTINLTANANDVANKLHYIDRPGVQNIHQVYLNPGQSTSRTSTNPPIPNGTVVSFSAYSLYNTYSYSNTASINTPDCTLPRQFNVSVNSTPGAVCPAEGWPKLTVNISKSANATVYELYTYERDGSGNYTIPVPAARRDYTSNDLFPGADIISNVGTATRTFDVQPNKSYGVIVVARNATGSWIYSNMATAMTGASSAAWSYLNAGWCDNTPPTIVLSSLAECFQPNQLPTNIQMTIVDNPGGGAPAGSVSGVDPSSIRFLLNALNNPGTVWQYPHQNQNGNIFSRVFTAAEFQAGVDLDYELSAVARDNNNRETIMPKVLVSYARVCGAWIQTRQGNVHSEKEINTPGGPYE